MPRCLPAWMLLVLAGCPAAEPDVCVLAPDVDTLAFPDVDLDRAVDGVVTLSNPCPEAIAPQLQLEGEGFAVAFVPSEPVPAGGDLPLLVSFTAPDYAPYEGQLRVGGAAIALRGQARGDQDDDGHDALAAGGDDCDDTRRDTHPGAVELYYDGIDQDCGGDSDFDRDHDGHDRIPEGGDCDDTDARRYPTAIETRDAVDEDCDGIADEGLVPRGDVVIAEIMGDPTVVPDARGEWIEVLNTSSSPVNLVGWSLSDGIGDAAILPDLVIPAGQLRVLGVSSAPAQNGYVHVDAVWDAAAFALPDTAGVVRLDVEGFLMHEVRIDAGWAAVPGVAFQLDPTRTSLLDAQRASSWCKARTTTDGGDKGSPGEVNPWCASIDHDGDGQALIEGDCDDTDPDVLDGGLEVWDGKDNDCDLRVDRAEVETLSTGRLSGSADDHLGSDALALADLDGDGRPEAIVGGRQLDVGGGVYVIEASSLSGFLGLPSAIDKASWLDLDDGGVLDRHPGDVTGDGVADLVVAGTGSPGVVALAGGLGINGTLSSDDAVFTIEATSGSVHPVLSSADLDGDGVAELVHADRGYGTSGQVWLHASDGLSGAIDLDDADATLIGGGSDLGVGYALAGADLDGDGYDDLIVTGAYRTSWGAAWVFPGGSWPTDVNSATTRITGASGERLGMGDVALGDLDDDGTLDLVVASSNQDTLWWFQDLGGLSGVVDSVDADGRIRRSGGPTSLGASLDLGDLDGDGLDDLVAGAPDDSALSAANADEPGEVYVFLGASLLAASGTLDEDDADWTAGGSAYADLLGWLLVVGDTDADGVDDVMVAAPNRASATGSVFTVLGPGP